MYTTILDHAQPVHSAVMPHTTEKAMSKPLLVPRPQRTQHATAEMVDEPRSTKPTGRRSVRYPVIRLPTTLAPYMMATRDVPEGLVGPTTSAKAGVCERELWLSMVEKQPGATYSASRVRG